MLPEALKTEVKAAVAVVEADMGLKFGDVNTPLLVSVRSGAAVSVTTIDDMQGAVGLPAGLAPPSPAQLLVALRRTHGHGTAT